MAFLYVLWVLLNVVLGVGLVLAWYRCLQLFARRHSRGASIALCIVTLMTCRSSQPPVPPRTSSIAIVWSAFPINQPVRYPTRLLSLPLAHLDQNLHFSPDGESSSEIDSIRIQQDVALTGLTTGLRWEPIQLHISPLPNQRIQYTTVGVLNWRLLNVDVYRQSLTYTGVLSAHRQSSR